jgi:uncharacterized protein (DUF2384 family)
VFQLWNGSVPSMNAVRIGEAADHFQSAEKWRQWLQVPRSTLMYKSQVATYRK